MSIKTQQNTYMQTKKTIVPILFTLATFIISSISSNTLSLVQLQAQNCIYEVLDGAPNTYCMFEELKMFPMIDEDIEFLPLLSFSEGESEDESENPDKYNDILPILPLRKPYPQVKTLPPIIYTL